MWNELPQHSEWNSLSESAATGDRQMAHAFGLGASPLVTGAHGVEMPGVELHASVELSVSEESRESASRQPGVVTSAIVERASRPSLNNENENSCFAGSPRLLRSRRGAQSQRHVGTSLAQL